MRVVIFFFFFFLRLVKDGLNDKGEEQKGAERRRKWEGGMHMIRIKNIPSRGNMDQGHGLRVWLGRLKKNKGPVRVCVVSEGEMGGRSSVSKGGAIWMALRKTLGSTQEYRKPLVFLPTLDLIMSQHDSVTISFYFMSYLLSLFPLRHVLLCHIT